MQELLLKELIQLVNSNPSVQDALNPKEAKQEPVEPILRWHFLLAHLVHLPPLDELGS